MNVLIENKTGKHLMGKKDLILTKKIIWLFQVTVRWYFRKQTAKMGKKFPPITSVNTLNLSNHDLNSRYGKTYESSWLNAWNSLQTGCGMHSQTLVIFQYGTHTRMWFRARRFRRKSLLHSYKKLCALILLSAKILKHVGGSHHRETGRSFQKQYLQQKEKEAGRYFIYSKAWLHLFKRSSNERKHKQCVSILSLRSHTYTKSIFIYGVYGVEHPPSSTKHSGHFEALTPLWQMTEGWGNDPETVMGSHVHRQKNQPDLPPPI